MKQYLQRSTVLTLIALVFLSFAEPVAADEFVLSMAKQRYRVGEQIIIDYSNFTRKADIYIYQDAAKLPLATYLNVKYMDGTFVVGDTLEQGNYRVEVVAGDDLLATTGFVVEEVPFNTDELNVMLLTDIHLMHPDLIVSEGKAINDVIESDRKMLRQSKEIFDALLDTIERCNPSVLIIPGDLTKDGEKISHQMVADGLKRLEDKGIECFVIPGNHDILNPYAVVFDGDERHQTDDVTPDDFRQIYRNFGYDDTTYQQDSVSLSYTVNLTPSICMIAIDANRWSENKSIRRGDNANSRIDYGRLADPTLQWVLDRADEATKNGQMVFAMMHHQLVEHFNEQRRMMASAAIEKGDSITQLFIEHNIHLVFTGHMHISNISVAYNENMTDSIVEVSTGSPITYPCPYRWITFSGDGGNVEILTRKVQSLNSLGDLQVFSREEIASRSDRLVRTAISSFSSQIIEKKQQMSATLPQVGKLMNAFPDNSGEMADMLIKYMHEACQLSLLTTSEANENRKLVERIRELVNIGYDNMIDDMAAENNFSLLEIYLFKTEVKNAILSMVEKPVLSILYDYSNYGTKTQNRTNDLFVNLSLAPARSHSLDNIPYSTDNYWYDIMGRRYVERPTQVGVYIRNGKKEIIR